MWAFLSVRFFFATENTRMTANGLSGGIGWNNLNIGFEARWGFHL